MSITYKLSVTVDTLHMNLSITSTFCQVCIYHAEIIDQGGQVWCFMKIIKSLHPQNVSYLTLEILTSLMSLAPLLLQYLFNGLMNLILINYDDSRQ